MAGKTQESSLNSTKQLLDELDALMEKMLSLPVSTQEAASLPEAPPDFPRMSATLTVLESSVETEESKTEPAPSYEVPSSPRRDEASAVAAPHADFKTRTRTRAQQEEALASPARTPGVRVDSALESELPLDAVPPSLLHVQIPEVEILPAPPRPLRNLLILPLLWINGIFDVATFFLGPFGRWLRTAQGRSFLAATGIGLILLAIGWVIRDWMSWTP